MASKLPDVLGEAFSHGRAETRTALVAAASVRLFEPGETILRQGDESSLTLILDGHVATRRTGDDGREIILRIVPPGELGLILPLAGRPASADAFALTSSAVARWPVAEVRALATADSGLALDLLDATLAIFETVVDMLDGLQYHDATRRVARVLHVHAGLFSSEPTVLTRGHLPMLVGTSREMTGRVLRVLESRRLVARVGRNRLVVLDPVGLAAAAQNGRASGAEPRRGTSSSS